MLMTTPEPTMTREVIELGDITIGLQRRQVKHVYLSVHPPLGSVTLVAPPDARDDVLRAYAITRLGWIRQQRERMHEQARETPRQYLERESHMLWGRRHLLSVVERDSRPNVQVDHRRITLSVRPGSSQSKREEVMHDWHRRLLHATLPPLIAQWEARLGVRVQRYFLQRMKTKWGSCNHRAGTVRFNTELVKKPKDLLEYVVVHELIHLLEPRHNERFKALLDVHCPSWREARLELNALPLSAAEQPRGARPMV